MILYVDETESDDLFIVAGLLVNSKQDAEMVFKRFKNVLRLHLNNQDKDGFFKMISQNVKRV